MYQTLVQHAQHCLVFPILRKMLKHLTASCALKFFRMPETTLSCSKIAESSFIALTLTSLNVQIYSSTLWQDVLVFLYGTYFKRLHQKINSRIFGQFECQFESEMKLCQFK